MRLALLGLVALLGGCVGAPGYLVDIFPEMHYAPFYRPQEPPRLAPPTQSVPVGGKELAYTLAQAKDLANPVPQGPETLARAVEVYLVDCAICHGPTGRGNGVMAERFAQAGATRPVDFASDRARSRTDGELFWLITNGIGFMPRFGPLLTEEERWRLVHYLRLVQEQTPSPPRP